MQNNPDLATDRLKVEKEALKWLKDNNYSKGDTALITIPVVFHIVYNTAAQNVDDSLVFSQLEVLNNDFRRLNADTINTRLVFDSIAADVQIEFCLANKDPQGNWTTGINRVQTTQTSFVTSPFDDGVKSSASGGVDPWDASKYLNIWVCDMSFNGTPFVLGYAQFPGDNPATDGVVITYQHFGHRPWDSNAAPANLGRTASHEVGHWLGLYHVWGDGDCTQIDSVPDTPNADAASQSDCDTLKNTCDDSSTPFWLGYDAPDMVENYMDYSADACMNMFSEGQKTRIWSFLNTDRVSLLTSDGCSWPASIESVENNNAIRIYPNPTNNLLNIEWSSSMNLKEISILNYLGQEMMVMNGFDKLESTSINLSELANGVYFVKLRSEKTEIVERVVVKD